MASPSDFFECRKCGDCCRGYGGTFVTDRDIKRISAYLGIEPEFFLSHYCEWSGNRPLIKSGEDGYCVFWDEVCTIHEVKPRMCKIWPFIDSVLVDPGNWAAIRSVCPGARDNGSPRELLDCVRGVLEAYETEAGIFEGEPS